VLELLISGLGVTAVSLTVKREGNWLYATITLMYVPDVLKQLVKYVVWFAVIIGMLKRWFNLEVDKDFNTLIEICNEAYPEDAE